MASTFTRRDFLKQTTVAATGTLLLGGQTSRGRISANDKLNIGFIGVANRAGADLEEVAREVNSVNVAALCDIDDTFLAKAKEKYPGAKTYNDFRRLLDQKDLDAIYKSVIDEKEKYQQQYDDETDYSRNKTKQEEWLKKIESELKQNRSWADY